MLSPVPRLSSGEDVLAAGTTSHPPLQQLESRVAKHTAGPPMASSSAVPSVATEAVVAFVTTIHTSLQRHLLPVGTLGCEPRDADGAESCRGGFIHRPAWLRESHPGRSQAQGHHRSQPPRAVTEGHGGDSPAALDTRPSSLSPECHSHTGPTGAAPPPPSHSHPWALQAARESTSRSASRVWAPWGDEAQDAGPGQAKHVHLRAGSQDGAVWPSLSLALEPGQGLPECPNQRREAVEGG